jgi:hypothetical protein
MVCQKCRRRGETQVCKVCSEVAELVDWHERFDRSQCHAASYRNDGECHWRYCPARDGVCPLEREP